MIRFSDAAVVGAPPTRVFEFISNLENLPKIQSDVVQSTVLDPGPVLVGTRFEELVKIGPRHVTARCVVTELEPGRLLGFRAESRAVDYEGRFVVEPASEGSRVTIEGSARLRGAWRLLQPLLAADVKRGVQQELDAIRKHTELP